MMKAISFRATDVKAKENVQVEDKKTASKAKVVNSFGGTVGALAAGCAIHQFGPLTIYKPLLQGIHKYGNLSAEDGDVVKNAVKQMVVDTGLDKKGVRVKFLNDLKKVEDVNEAAKIAETPKNIDKFLKGFNDILFVDQVKEGNNAFFTDVGLKLPKITLSEYERLASNGDMASLEQKLNEVAYYIKPNSVVLSKNKNQIAGFHEVGHAMNYNLSKVGRFLYKCRPIALAAPIVIGTYGAITKKSKLKEEGTELNGIQKTNNFIRNNAGKLTFLATVPMLIEEAMASVKGQIFANKRLKPDLAKRVLKSNMVAYMSYIAASLFASLGVVAAVKIKDNAIAKKEAKLQLKQELAEQKLAEQELEMQELAEEELTEEELAEQELAEEELEEQE